MRVWTLFPTELDCLRRRAQYREIDMILWSISRSRAAAIRRTAPIFPVGGFVTAPWSRPVGLYHLVRLYTFLAPQPMDLAKYEDLREDIERVARKRLNPEFKMQPESWPPKSIVSIEWVIADLKDLQTRWRDRLEQKPNGTDAFTLSCRDRLLFSLGKYGTWSGGQLKGTQTLAESITTKEVARYKRRLGLE